MKYKHKVFCDEYMIDYNASAAAIRAGYKPTNVNKVASQLLTRLDIAAYIDSRKAEVSKRLGVNQERIMAELAKIAFVNTIDAIDSIDATIKDNASRDDTSVISSIKVKTITTSSGTVTTEREIRLADKVKALELLCKTQSMLTDKIDLAVQGTIIIDASNDLQDT